MNMVWSFDGISVGSITMNRWDGSQMWTSGFGWRTNPDTKDREPFQWEATALKDGWYVVITRPHGKIGEFQGSTFNLPLEVASAVGHLIPAGKIPRREQIINDLVSGKLEMP